MEFVKRFWHRPMLRPVFTVLLLFFVAVQLVTAASAVVPIRSIGECSDSQKWALGVGGTSAVATTYCASRGANIQFSFKSAFWLPLDKVGWLLVTDTNATLAASTSFQSHGEGNIYLQSDYQYVSLVLQCANADMACQGTASIAAYSKESVRVVSASSLSLADPIVQDRVWHVDDASSGNCFSESRKPVQLGYNEYIVLKCNVTSSLATGAVFSAAIASPPIGSYSLLVLNSKNWNKFSHDVTPDCLNDNCYDVVQQSTLQAWTLQSTEPTPSYYLVLQSKSLIPLYYQVTLSISAPQSVLNLTGLGWRKRVDNPVGCSDSTWPSAFIVGQQRGIFYLMKDISNVWSVLRTDENPSIWSVTTSDGTTWTAPIATSDSLYNLMWSSPTTHHHRSCQVQFSLITPVPMIFSHL
eukprot:TRINITY_DN6235_c0_g1_i1.p1 TRINITY_DN6235_c0_g1~~TRINITY_DN6235_c0_g1_i1.p1  ORF type:complete len:411 (+),score=28.24 TRINITY_DN6235_c0_g1_i1:71-1303(+)